jgi:hypothetical protein
VQERLRRQHNSEDVVWRKLALIREVADETWR